VLVLAIKFLYKTTMVIRPGCGQKLGWDGQFPLLLHAGCRCFMRAAVFFMWAAAFFMWAAAF
jgi:hypothetical protein